nr:hypothetical protein [Paraburkholderia ultramafica]
MGRDQGDHEPQRARADGSLGTSAGSRLTRGGLSESIKPGLVR